MNRHKAVLAPLPHFTKNGNIGQRNCQCSLTFHIVARAVFNFNSSGEAWRFAGNEQRFRGITEPRGRRWRRDYGRLTALTDRARISCSAEMRGSAKAALFGGDWVQRRVRGRLIGGCQIKG